MNEAKEQQHTVQAENPEIFTGIRFAAPKDVAGGAPAVYNAVKHVFGAMGPLRGWKALAKLNQKGGHDCPGCAWPDPDDHRSGIAEYCENGAKAIAEEATTHKLTAAFFAENSISSLSHLSDYEIGKKGRLAEPMYRPAGADHYEPISWEAAYDKIAAHLNGLASPDKASFYTSGRTSNEAAFLYQLFVREFGTNNLPDCSNMCHESSGVALNESVGIGKGSVKLEDFYEAEVIIILGQNPGTNHPRMMSALQKAKRNGAKIISINPLKESGLLSFSNPQEVGGMLGGHTTLTDLYLQVRINGDIALLKAVNHLLQKADEKAPGTVFDQDFIRDQTIDAEPFLEHLRGLDLNYLAEQSGIALPLIEEMAMMLAPSKKIIACWAMGLTQHKNAVDTIREVVNLLLLKGSIGKPGAGTCPVRGHSNVQGDRTMGIYEKPPQAFLDRIENSFGFRPPQHHGYDVVESIEAMHEGKVKVFLCLGGNFLSATPDTLFTAEALQRCNLTVQMSTKLNRSHLITGKEAIILPCLGRTDRDIVNGEAQFVTVENSMGVVHSSRGNLEPISKDLRSEPVIVAQLAQRVLGDKSRVEWKKYLRHYDAIRDDIARTIPGFDRFNERVRQPAGFYLPNGAREGRFNTLSGKAGFHIGKVIETKLNPGELVMMTIRSHDQFNTTIYGLDDRYRGIFHERRVIMMNRDDMKAHQLTAGDVVDLYNHHGGTERVARRFIVTPYDIPRGCTATYFPEANVLVPLQTTAEKSNTPMSKMVVITLKKQAEHVNLA
jgi:molybdopterin-dependent oxidoreductase alpha subunit